MYAQTAEMCVCVYIYIYTHTQRHQRLYTPTVEKEIYFQMEGMVLCAANYVPLTPISFLERAAFVYGDRVSIVYGDMRYMWRETHDRCIKLASALSQLGISQGDIVAAVAPNIPELYELHFGVPMAGAVLCALNTRLNATILSQKLRALEAKAIFVDYQFIEVVRAALGLLFQTNISPPILILILETGTDHLSSSSIRLENSAPADGFDYQSLLAMGKMDFQLVYPKDECDPISINYTSGSTGKPKGAIYSHRAAYLNSLAILFRTGTRQMPVFLWTVDMFRCNGWCFPWTIAALGGTNICLRDVTGKAILDNIFLHNVTHFCGPPTLLTKIAKAAAEGDQPLPQLPHNVDVTVAGAMPHSQILSKLEAMGFSISCAYGMSEALGPVTSIPRKSQYETSHSNEEDKLKVREGTHNQIIVGVDVKDPETMASVPPDGETIGEVMFRGNTIMLGYLKNSQATQEAFKGGWYRTKDVGVRNPNGDIQLKDRGADVIVSGGEKISSLEVEAVVANHPMAMEAAVVGRPDDVLGETPCAFVKLREGFRPDSEEIINFCASRLPDYMAPKTVIFGELPVNCTGKIQKFVLRERLRRMDG